MGGPKRRFLHFMICAKNDTDMTGYNLDIHLCQNCQNRLMFVNVIAWQVNDVLGTVTLYMLILN